MTREEVAYILEVIQTEWRHDFRGMTAIEKANILSLWEKKFADDDAKLVGAAVDTIIVAGNMKYAPNIGAIKEQMRKLTDKQDMSEAEAWAKIKRAISNGLYGAKEEYERLPPLCQKLVGSPSQLWDWASLDSDELNTVVASNVQRAYRTMQQRENETAKLPSEVKAYISVIAKQLSLEDRNVGS